MVLKGSTAMSSHWEKRIFQDEYMSATAPTTPIYSAMTLAVFEDSGWYTANYSMAQTLPWGYLEGCTFATALNGMPKATVILQLTNQVFLEVSITLVTQVLVFSGKNVIFLNSLLLGGQDSYSDYCPLYVGYSNGDWIESTTYTTSSVGEILSSRSQCFQSTFSASGSCSSTPVCYAVDHCTKTAMTVNVGNTQVSCPMAGGQVSVPGLQGTLTCPPANTICQRLQRECSGLGVLQIACYNGANCSLITCPAKNGVECAGHGTSDGTTGQCNCDQGYTGLSCGSLTCSIVNNEKFAYTQCSNHGICNPNTGGTCSCGYTGNTCQCVPGYPNCSVNGTCDCLTGSCVCYSEYYGLTFLSTQPPPMTTLVVDNKRAYAGSAVSKGYQLFKVLLNSSSSDITVALNSTTGVLWRCIRFWSGEACNVPRCRPNCVDFNDCKIPGSSTSRTTISNGLRNTTDCYGNGVCTIFTINGIEQPKSVCDPAYTCANPTDAQSMCNVPMLSISYVQNYNSSFVVFAQTLNQQVGIGLWALYTITVKSNWSYLYVELESSVNSGDPLVLVRKNTLPSLDITRPYPLQFSDAASWAAMATKQRILLTRTASTLSDGLLYIDWMYLTFEVPDSSVAYVKAVSSVFGENDAMPLLMVRGPLKSGFPSLDLSSSYDFDSVASGKATLEVVVPVNIACSGSSLFNIAITNNVYAADVLQAQVTLLPLPMHNQFIQYPRALKLAKVTLSML
ncbi:leishmanolysin-like peptidase [Thraustotheca clavata]|uniref:Leishmanolysin-like peptidase n=1 Tax=Thraustotheca clavata TaxID=74557 RepID=A0A1V9YLZ2_9STRA|nr:leishmanolysin-like peptidase [Thraustotheca clavata]